jgi:membrane-bound serine protease (ClpP class)
LISPVTRQYIVEAIGRAENANAACLVIELDTPGGLLESTREIVKRMMNARTPIVVYVAPSGARAGSAGVFITLAAHVAAMAPSTNIGAAHPIVAGGLPDPLSEKPGRTPSIGHDDAATSPSAAAPAEGTAMQKVVNDTVAWISGIARVRGRNVDWARRAVTESVSIGETEALQKGVIDLIARDQADLLAKIDGRRVELASGPVTLHTAGVAVRAFPMNARQRFLAIITHPNVAYLLLMLGTLGLIFEFTHPGLAFPGIAGLVCLLLALYAFQVLPVNYAALALLLIGLGLMVAEVKVVSHGLLALGGAICLVLGSLLLFQSPSMRVSLGLILPTVATLTGITLLVLHRAVSSFRLPSAAGREELMGKLGKADTDLSPDGQVFIHSEIWNATAVRPISRGARVRVVRVDGLHLLVEPADADVSSTDQST